MFVGSYGIFFSVSIFSIKKFGHEQSEEGRVQGSEGKEWNSPMWLEE